jgi:hypothetical protein
MAGVAAAVVVEDGLPRREKNVVTRKTPAFRVGPRTVAQTWGTQDLYLFRPLESSTLRPVCAAVLSALICSRGYK